MNATVNTKTNIRDAFEQLEQAISNIDSNEAWLNYLSFQSRFYNYSFSNMIMIYMQNPKSSYVAGYKAWQRMGRQVKKGEKSIKILAPIRYKVENENTNEKVFILKCFRLASVFDLSQTDGDDDKLPALITGLKGELQEDTVYTQLLTLIDIPVAEVDSIKGNGCYNIDSQSIQIKSTISSTQKVKTLVHEYAHHLHHIQHFNNESYDIGEVIAESTAFIVCNHLGIDSSDYSFGYIKGWGENVDTVKAVGHKSQAIAKHIIEKLQTS